MAILRAVRLEESLESEILRQLVTRCATLPTVPALYSEIIEVLQDPETNMETIGDILVKDGGMTARILKLANSAFFGLGREISSISEGVAYLGTETIKSLLLFSNAFSPHENTMLPGFAAESLWRHSLEVANASKAVAAYEGVDRKAAEEAYVSGLLHDVGKLVLAANLSEQYQQAIDLARSDKIPLYAAERKIFGADHADVGGYLLGLWGLPVPLVEAIAFHHRPAATVQKTFAPLTALHAGNALASSDNPAISGIPLSAVDQSYLNDLDLGDRMEVWRKVWQSREIP
jgi:HD-like signal output (HDOD) protein